VNYIIQSNYHSNCAATDSHDPLMRGRPTIALAHREFGQGLAATEELHNFVE
jgi:hypothetical protein